jgi:hypothetical protein
LLSRGVLNYLRKLKVSKLSQFGRVKTLKLLSSTCGAFVWIGRAIILDPTHSLVKNQGGASGDVNGRRVPVKPKKELPKKMQKAPTSSPGNSMQ